MQLPLTNPVLIFALILFIILFAPIILNKFKIPHLIGLIIAGAVIGPYGFHLMDRDSSIVLFGTVGLLYIMFLAGLEMDMVDFKKNSRKSVIFGMYTFCVPMILAGLTAYYIFGFSLLSSILFASMLASHTLIAYPIISKFGVAKNRAVNVAVGGTLITDTLALLVLAVIAGMAVGEVDNAFWIKLSVSIVLFVLIIVFIFPLIGRSFFKRYDDNISQYIFVLAMVFLGAFLAESAGIEAIIGAFLVGLAFNRLIPQTSPLMNRIEFVGNALFIPFFLIGVGMLVDFRAFFKGWDSIFVAAVMTIVAMTAKFIAAWLAQKSFRFTIDERRLIFGLSNSQAAATLATVMVGYNIILNQAEIDAAVLVGEIIEPIRLLNENVLNGSIIMILVTCTVASIVAQKGAKNIALQEAAGLADNHDDTDIQDRVLVSTNNSETVEELINFSLTIKSQSDKRNMYALSVVDSNISDDVVAKSARKVLDTAVSTAAAADVKLKGLLRYDVNVVNGITSVAKEHKITHLVMGLHQKKGFSDNFLGNLTEGILTKFNATTLIYKPSQPLSTIRRFVIVVPERAEREIGFPFWLKTMWNIARNTGAKLVFYATERTLRIIKLVARKYPVNVEFVEFKEWGDFLIITKDLKHNDNLVLILSRRDRPSYNESMSNIPYYLNRYFQNINFLLIYPMQVGVGEDSDGNLQNQTALDINDIGKTLTSIFRKK